MNTALLQYVDEVEPSDFALEQADYDRLCAAIGEEVILLREAADGYFDIALADGTKFDAISTYHLRRAYTT